MKYVIKTLLFINLILQMTSSLRKCFDHNQNIMLTIILLAFSLIGLIGLMVGNRFILIIFAACMTLVLIASITIYAIGASDQDGQQPKVPYYAQESNLLDAPTTSGGGGGGGGVSKVKSFVSKLLTGQRNKKLRNASEPSNGRRSAKRPAAHAPTVLVAPALLLEDYPDEAAPIAGRSGASQPAASTPPTVQPSEPPPANQDQQRQELGGPQVRSEQWAAYERLLYQRYLAIVSQSFDLIMHTILASWMALLLDEDSDQCFGGAHSSRRRRGTAAAPADARKQSVAAKEAPIYNYNGVRYSIKPEPGESPTRIVLG